MGFLKRLFGKKDSKKETPKEEPEKAIKDEKSVENDSQKKAKPTKDTPRKYHVSLNRDEKSDFYKMWRVRMEKSEKTIKYFKTQEEAITYAEGLAEEANSSVVIHKKDGSIRKQIYTKKNQSV